MAFQTIRGESGVDFIGSEGVDILFSLNESGEIVAEGNGGNDDITVSNFTGVVGTATIKGGEGDDTISFDLGGEAANNTRIITSSVNGGAGDDAITLEGAISSVARGNADDDDFVLRGNYTDSVVNGNSGEDSFLTAGAGITLSNSKILGGSDNDGAMTFANIESAVDSTINGSAGNDNVTIGSVGSATNFTVFGGQGNDVLSYTTGAGTDATIVLSGDLGDDELNGNAAADSLSGGDGSDIIDAGDGSDTVDGGTGDDVLTGGAGNDVILGGDGNDTITDGAGDDTITGGAGADTYTTGNATVSDTYVIGSISDSAATTTGTTVGFDTFAGRANGDTVNLIAVAESLMGNAADTLSSVNVVDNSVGNGGAAVDVATFAALRTQLATTLTASGNNAIQGQIITIDSATDAIDGTYLILNGTNTSLDSSDLMFAIPAGNGARGDFANADTYTLV